MIFALHSMPTRSNPVKSPSRSGSSIAYTSCGRAVTWRIHSSADGHGRPRREAVAVQVSVGEVERRSLDVYESAAAGGV